MKKIEEKSKTWDPPNSAPLKQVSSCPPPPNELVEGGQEPERRVRAQTKLERGNNMNKEGKTQRNSKIEDTIAKITILSTASSILNDLLVKANSGSGVIVGKVSRQDLASFIIRKATGYLTDKDFVELRNSVYSDNDMLEAAYKQMKTSGDIPDFIKEALRKHYLSHEEQPKKIKRPLTKESINDGLREEGINEGQ